MPLWKNIIFCHVWLVLVIGHSTPVFFLNPQSINCPMLWIKLASAWEFSLPHLLAPFSQDPLPPEQQTPRAHYLLCHWLLISFTVSGMKSLYGTSIKSNQKVVSCPHTYHGITVPVGISWQQFCIIAFRGQFWVRSSVSFLFQQTSPSGTM